VLDAVAVVLGERMLPVDVAGAAAVGSLGADRRIGFGSALPPGMSYKTLV